MSLLLALLLAASPSAESRGPSEYRAPTALADVAPAVRPSGEVPLDKLLHASVAANLSLGVAGLARGLGAPPTVALLLGMGLSTLLGLVKEVLLDLALGLGTFDPFDLAANGVGMLAGSAVGVLMFSGEF